MNERPIVSLIQACVNEESLGSMKKIGQKGNILFKFLAITIFLGNVLPVHWLVPVKSFPVCHHG